MKNIKSIETIAKALNLPDIWYCIGQYQEEAYCIETEGDVWVVYFGERGERQEPCEFADEIHACHDFWNRLAHRLFRSREYDEILLKYIQHNNRIPPERQSKSIEKLRSHEDVYLEFLLYTVTGVYIEEDALSIQGYTAKQISAETKLTPLGVFNYLIYLREKPQEALENLKKGLPIKDSIPPWSKPPIYKNNLAETEGQPEGQPLNEKEDIQSVGELPDEDSLSKAEAIEPEKQSGGANAAVLGEKLEEALKALSALQTSFDDKIAVDQHKNQLFDNMHRELTKYQNGLLEKAVNTMAMDIIQFADSVKKTLGIYEGKEPNEDNYGKLLRVLGGVAEDLDDILYRQGIEPYAVAGDDVDARRQKIIKTVETDEEKMNNKIAARIAVGYEKEGKTLRQEIINIYKFKYDTSNKG